MVKYICAENTESISSCFRGAEVTFLDTISTVQPIQALDVSPSGQVSQGDDRNPVIV